MNIQNTQVKHITLGAGIVTKHEGNYIDVEFASRSCKFVFPDAFEKFLTAADPSAQTEIIALIEKKREAEKPKIIPPVQTPTTPPKTVIPRAAETKQCIPAARSEGKRRTFFVFQGKTFQKEYQGGYMWAPITNKVGTVPHHWARMTEVLKGDIIFHGCNGYIQAISVAKDRYYDSPQPKELTVEDMWDRDGRRIDCEYTYLSRPVKPSEFVSEIQKYSQLKYSPFKSDGTGNMGYLFDLRPELAKVFLEAAVKRNPSIADIAFIKEFLQ